MVLDRTAKLPLRSRLATSTARVPVWCLTAPGSDAGRRAALAAQGVEIVEVPEGARGLDLPAALRALAARGVNRLMIEGGPTLAGQVLERIADEIHLVTTPVMLTAETGLLAFGERPVTALTEDPRWMAEAPRMLGADTLTVWRRAA
jgi:diaminohydroxyphosphoribosylaminopyrimidine deaminase/5-amino-6-(5-phosphoribosylamino)uracil reductase